VLTRFAYRLQLDACRAAVLWRVLAFSHCHIPDPRLGEFQGLRHHGVFRSFLGAGWALGHSGASAPPVSDRVGLASEATLHRCALLQNGGVRE
jgi:hypothetical protein